MWRVTLYAVWALAVSLAFPAHAAELELAADTLEGPGFSARKLRLSFSGAGPLKLSIGEFSAQGKTWRNVGLACREAALEANVLQCREGALELSTRIPVRFSYSFSENKLEAELTPEPGERWRIAARFGGASWSASLTVDHGQAAHFGAFVPDGVPRPSAGRLTGSASLTGKRDGLQTLALDLGVAGLAFSDASGLHAGDNVSGRIGLRAEAQHAAWSWRGEAVWKSGEIFWQPFYGKGANHRVAARGLLDSRRLVAEQGSVALDGVGEAQFSGALAREERKLTDFELRGDDIDLSELHRLVLKPLLDQTGFSELTLTGKMNLAWRYRGGKSETFHLALRDAGVEDGRKRFALRQLHADLPWSASEEGKGDVRFESGALFGMDLGATRVPFITKGMRVSMPKAVLPVLDGRLTLGDFEAEVHDGAWQWQFGGGVSGISMERLTAALGLTPMHGSLAGVIPRVGYRNSTLKVDGALLFRVFDGAVVAKNLVLLEPWGRAPRLTGDVEMRGLDLELLTRAFSFGSIQGRLDVDVAELALSNWIPVRFDARVRSSPGEYPKKISQTAVQNISALGGAGAAAAIQRSFLRFFDQFRYSKIGLSCALRNGVCQMGGVEDAPNGYVIVKGGGIPAITVMGYNRSVNWDELLTRLKRITRGNASFEMR